MSRLLAQISNPTVPAVQEIAESGGNSGMVGAGVLSLYIALGIQTAIVLGGLAVLVYFFLGAISWISAGGDKGRVEKARERMVQAAVGLVVLVSIIAFIGFLGPLIFGFDILQLNFVNQIDSSASGSVYGTQDQWDSLIERWR